jgi:organic radical activating enzyme
MNARIIKNGSYQDYEAEHLIIAGKNTFKNWKCSAGSEGIYIDWDGNIWPATCFTNNLQHKLGSINDNLPIKQLSEYVTCSKNTCFCMAEIYLPKYKDSLDNLIEGKQDTVSILDFDAVTRANSFDKNRKSILWAFGRLCNFDCSYCDDISHNKTDPPVSEKSIEKFLEYITQFRNNTGINWSFSGGEPTLNKHFLPLVKKLSSLGDAIAVSTNGSQSADYYLELLNYSSINLSVHFEYLKLNKIKRIIKKLLDAGPEELPNRLGLNFMVTPGKVQLCIDYLNELKQLPTFDNYITVRVDILRIKNSSDYYAYSDKEKEIIKRLQQNNWRLAQSVE